ncbi:hypothetical protein VFPPC_15587 [Pochonia chlamydosporia 170]|uniref:Uncharacterized protein n=1 Tax=Pochonia chlamydosporia 170 TaxID=1380566 RepID=A0A179FZ30_METCM|nr:hypothetical protein VFPPC_15587 [Pochonia chlamydosporia 170]OAQ70488.1 hypothetical protein VFPPC_15587 [Pochonia chlamydosporia 170]
MLSDAVKTVPQLIDQRQKFPWADFRGFRSPQVIPKLVHSEGQVVPVAGVTCFAGSTPHGWLVFVDLATNSSCSGHQRHRLDAGKVTDWPMSKKA